MPDDGAALTLHDVGIGAERILAEIAIVRAELAELRSLLTAREYMSPSRLHVRKGAQLATEVSAAIGDAVFTVFELVEHARREDRQLLGALVDAVGPLDGGATRRIGRLLARIEGVSLPAGCRVERTDEAESDCAAWRVARI